MITETLNAAGDGEFGDRVEFSLLVNSILEDVKYATPEGHTPLLNPARADALVLLGRVLSKHLSRGGYEGALNTIAEREAIWAFLNRLNDEIASLKKRTGEDMKGDSKPARRTEVRRK